MPDIRSDLRIGPIDMWKCPYVRNLLCFGYTTILMSTLEQLIEVISEISVVPDVTLFVCQKLGPHIRFHTRIVELR